MRYYNTNINWKPVNILKKVISNKYNIDKTMLKLYNYAYHHGNYHITLEYNGMRFYMKWHELRGIQDTRDYAIA